MKIIYNSIFPPKSYMAINLFSIIFARKEYGSLSKEDVNHESIHTAQGKELLWLFFYLWYLIEWFIRVVQYRNTHKAYRNISFEREAYANDRNLIYLEKRGKYAFIRYLKKK